MRSIKRHSNDMGRPSSYTSELAAKICERLASGESLRAICRDDHMPQWQTIYRWMKADSELSNRIAQAREVGFDAIAEEALEISDTPVVGEETEDDGEKVKVKRGDMLGHRKLQIETRLKLLAKWCPAKYGDKQTVAHEGGMTLQVVTGVTDPSDITDLI